MIPVFGFLTVTGTGAFLIGVLALLGVFVGAYIFRRDTEKEGRRRKAIDIAAFFTEIGLDHVGEFFKAYAVGDYSGMWTEASMILRIIGSPDTRKATLRKLRETLIRNAMADPVSKAELKAQLKELFPPKPSVPVTDPEEVAA